MSHVMVSLITRLVDYESGGASLSASAAAQFQVNTAIAAPIGVRRWR